MPDADARPNAPQSPRPSSASGHSARIGELLTRLGWAAPLTMIVVALLVAFSFYWLQARPLAESASQVRQQEATARVVARVESLVTPLEQVLLMARTWSGQGLLGLDDVTTFNRLLIPVLQQHAMINAIYLARDDGRMIYLQRSADGWKNRLTDVARHGQRQRWLTWRDASTLLGEEWLRQDYDPRQRPWYRGALATAPDQVAWTAPYVFTITPDPGITATVRWIDPAGQQWVMAIDVMLTDISRFTTQLHYGDSGQVALLTLDNRVLGLPANAGFRDEAAWRPAILQTPAQLGLPLLAQALRQLEGVDPGVVVAVDVAGQGERWLASQQPLNLRNQVFRVVMLAPRSEFSPWFGSLLAALAALALLVLVAGLAMSRQIARHLSAPLKKVFQELETSNGELAVQMLHASVVAELAPRLQTAESFAALAQIMLRGLGARIELGQGSLYRADVAGQRLLLCGSFAQPEDAGLPGEIAFGEGLAGQCASDAQPICLRQPGASYLQARSVLMQRQPAEILLLPIRNHTLLLGVLELAPLRPLTADDRKLIDSLLPLLALCMEILERNARTQDLLDATQRQAGELVAQQARIQKVLAEQDAIFQNAPMGLLYVVDGFVHQANSELAWMLDRPEKELTGLEIVSLFRSTEDYRQFCQAIGGRLADGAGVRIEWQLPGRGAQPLWTIISIQRFAMAGVEQAAIWAVAEITGRKQVEETLGRVPQLAAEAGPSGGEATSRGARDSAAALAGSGAKLAESAGASTEKNAEEDVEEDADPDAATLAQIARTVAGLDVAEGMARVMERVPLYLSMLRKFLAGQRQCSEAIDRALRAGDWPLAERLAHTLKGVAGNIGAHEVRQRASQLEQAVRERQPWPTLQALQAALAEPLEQLLATLAPALNSAQPAPVVVLDPALLQEVCQRLAALLADDDAEAGDVLAAHADLLRTALGADWPALLAAVQAFDFAAAREHLRAWARTRGWKGGTWGA